MTDKIVTKQIRNQEKKAIIRELGEEDNSSELHESTPNTPTNPKKPKGVAEKKLSDRSLVDLTTKEITVLNVLGFSPQ